MADAKPYTGWMLASFVDSSGSIIGFRVALTGPKPYPVFKELGGGKRGITYCDWPSYEIKESIESGALVVENLVIWKSELYGKGGDIKNYPTIPGEVIKNKDGDIIKPLGKASSNNLVILSGSKDESTTSYKVTCVLPETGMILENVPLTSVQKYSFANGTVSANGGAVILSHTMGEYELAQSENTAVVGDAAGPQVPDMLASNAPLSSSLLSGSAVMSDTDFMKNLSENRAAARKGGMIDSPVLTFNTAVIGHALERPDEYYNGENGREKRPNCFLKWNRMIGALQRWAPAMNAIFMTMATRAKSSGTTAGNSVVFTDDIETMAVGLNEFIVSPRFFAKLSDEEAVFILFHEVQHVMYRHVERTYNRNHWLRNMAEDYFINHNLYVLLGFQDRLGVGVDPRGKTVYSALAPGFTDIKDVDLMGDITNKPVDMATERGKNTGGIARVQFPVDILFDMNLPSYAYNSEQIYNALYEAYSGTDALKAPDVFQDGLIAGFNSGNIVRKHIFDDCSADTEHGAYDGAKAGAEDAIAGNAANCVVPANSNAEYAAVYQDAYQRAYDIVVDNNGYAVKGIEFDAPAAFTTESGPVELGNASFELAFSEGWKYVEKLFDDARKSNQNGAIQIGTLKGVTP